MPMIHQDDDIRMIDRINVNDRLDWKNNKIKIKLNSYFSLFPCLKVEQEKKKKNWQGDTTLGCAGWGAVDKLQWAEGFNARTPEEW